MRHASCILYYFLCFSKQFFTEYFGFFFLSVGCFPFYFAVFRLRFLYIFFDLFMHRSPGLTFFVRFVSRIPNSNWHHANGANGWMCTVYNHTDQMHVYCTYLNLYLKAKFKKTSWHSPAKCLSTIDDCLCLWLSIEVCFIFYL